MKKLDQASIQLLGNRSLFEEIHELKSSFIVLFSDLANEIPPRDLLALHPTSQGLKISKGNELQHCPYQVLDIIRDFDKEQGFNIRILNWWGRGLYVFIYFGKYNERILLDRDFLAEMQFQGYLLAKTSSPWDYKSMIDTGNLEPIDHTAQLSAHLEKFHYMQLVRKITYTSDYLTLKLTLKEQVTQILNFYRR
ncbi:MAG: hypothetical protein WD426_19950 [Anditalea sp.]